MPPVITHFGNFLYALPLYHWAIILLTEKLIKYTIRKLLIKTNIVFFMANYVFDKSLSFLFNFLF